jgi:glyoxylase-like metal-dependent hydrolase (beta-lactamase superfamily II)
MPDQLNGDGEQTRRSLRLLAGLDGTLLPGHGGPFAGGPAEAVARAEEAAR